MPTAFTLTGVVIDQGTEKTLSGATVRMKTPSEVLLVESNQYGHFAFPPIEVPDLPEDQEPYKLSIYAYYGEGRQQAPIPLIVKVNKEKPSQDIKINMVNRGPVSNLAGGIFLVVLIAMLTYLGYWYYDEHKMGTNENQEEVNYDIVNVLTEGLVDRITSDSTKVSGFKLEKGLIDTADILFMTAELDQIKESANELFTTSHLDSAYRSLVLRNLEDVNRGIISNNKERIQAALVSSKGYIQKIPSFKPGWLWKGIPGIYYEMFLWALFATLLRLIGNTSYYVSRNNFYRNSIFHKAALLFTIPLIALLIAFVMSFFKISIFVGGAEFPLDFSNPYISIIIAALIGLAPWKAWEFMYGLADMLFVGLKSWLGINKKGDVKSEGEEKKVTKQKTEDVPKPNPSPEDGKPSEATTSTNDSDSETEANIGDDSGLPSKPEKPEDSGSTDDSQV